MLTADSELSIWSVFRFCP